MNTTNALDGIFCLLDFDGDEETILTVIDFEADEPSATLNRGCHPDDSTVIEVRQSFCKLSFAEVRDCFRSFHDASFHQTVVLRDKKNFP